jgi:CDP-6-deoxy-D-xylo-4-hexulose-3-dehydrase
MTYELASITWDEEEYKAINRVIEKGMFTMGENVRRFEEDFAQKFGSKYAVMSNSGSSANLIAIAAFCYKKGNPLQPGDEVIVPAISWSTTFYPLMQYGLKLRFVDVELDTLNMDVSQLEAALTPKTKMVVGVSILGNPCALDVMRQFCDKHNLYFFEDNCESMGAFLNGKCCGTFGDIGTFSTFFSHHISTMEGGVSITDDEELYHLMLAIRSHGWTRHLPPETNIYEKTDDDFYEAYRFIVPGYNVRPLELSGAIGIEQLKKLDNLVKIRRENAETWVSLFGNDERFIIQKENGISSWFSFTVILNPELGLDKRKIFQTLKKEGIQFRIITGGNFLRHDVIKYCNHECHGEIVNANIAHDHGFFIGNHPTDVRNDIKRIHKILDEATMQQLAGAASCGSCGCSS